ncbi:MAG: hypothetical protein A2Y75_05270 [Candidatus Solincola sediminis]|uniref:Uncharacterized protein n=1 Tax=Candidatus Solincola sediminis TaxID=1797199 RepID=A0A1F2WG64_9ACTN|nr:MAG: hypothetical protein A2Y75_05270 [Candidatus Solincola sediminis]
MNLEPYVRPIPTFTVESSKMEQGMFNVNIHWNAHQSSQWTLTLDEINSLQQAIIDAINKQI